MTRLTVNFLLRDTRNVEILPTRDTLRCIIIVDEFISLWSPVTPMEFNVLISQAIQCALV